MTLFESNIHLAVANIMLSEC